MRNKNITFESINTETINTETIEKICDLERDMWARNEGLGEYMFCSSCDTIYSKQDIFSNLEKTIYSHTVSELEEAGYINNKTCNNCSGKLQACFSKKEYIEHIRHRYRDSSLLVLMKESSHIVGFMDGYFSNFDTIFERELQDHYEGFSIQQISNAIKNACDGILPEKLFSCSSMGTRESHMNFINIYSLLQNFFIDFPKNEEECPGISEINVGGTLDKIYSSLGAKRLEFNNNQGSTKTSSRYTSGIFIQPSLGKTYKNGFSLDARDFIRSLQALNK